ncbi:hypothetical protein F7725_022609 [Dissostichus mawsoni]|uniref:BH3-interacting domain death agonist n=1 Tax=Dissostichus mawsoni TaxID=36200 RepID=A0A7J5YY82_DISMA|nr:hypothetical protein F7725_022609 [Dissostichus mawsoni]
MKKILTMENLKLTDTCPSELLYRISAFSGTAMAHGLGTGSRLSAGSRSAEGNRRPASTKCCESGYQNLRRNMSNTPSEQWTEHLSREVQSVMQSVGLHHLSRERVMLALTLTLVKGVCVLAPQLLRSLFVTALQFLNHARATEEMTERHAAEER